MVDLLPSELFEWAPFPSLQAQGPCTQLAKSRPSSGGTLIIVSLWGGGQPHRMVHKVPFQSAKQEQSLLCPLFQEVTA